MTKKKLKQAGKHSGLGIASFVLSISTVLVFWGFIIWMLYSLLPAYEQIFDGSAESFAQTGQFRYMAVFSLFILLAPTVGLILGITALCQKNRKRSLAIAGVVVNSLFVLLFGIALFDRLV